MQFLHPLRTLLPVVALVVAAACGGTSTGGTGSGVTGKPGGQCSQEGAKVPSADGCNTCTCTNGTYACTEMACVTDAGSGPSCGPVGATKDAGDGCNTCTCSDSGEWLCTRSACKVCQPGETKLQPCGPACTCVNGAWSCETCTGCACDGGPAPICTPGERFQIGCGDWCVCDANGQPSSCTGTGCVPPPPACTDGATQSMGCNTCNCVNGAWMCTQRACPPPQCTNGDTKNDGCNSCTCMNGVWACTTRYCPPPVDAGPARVDAGPARVFCGAWAGNTCTANEYCAYTEGSMCGAADAEATCQPRPAICDTVLSPVCGCDGKDYGNQCMAAMAGTGVNHAGNCAAY